MKSTINYNYKRTLMLSILVILTFSIGYSQVGINSDGSSPDGSAMLDVKSITKGMLVPRMTTAQRNAIASPATGLLIFDTDVLSFWFYNGSTWSDLSGGGGGGGGATDEIKDTDGDTKIVTEKTLDEDTIRFSIKGVEHFLMDSAGHLHIVNTGNSVFIGQRAGRNDDGTNNRNIAIGSSALDSTISGDNNVAIGYKSLFSNKSGQTNVAIGNYSLYSNTKVGPYNGSGNVAIGHAALYYNTKGNYNAALGYESLYSNTEGKGNIAIGYRSLFTNDIGNFNTVNGYYAMRYNTEGLNNSAFGAFALNKNTEGDYNIAVGHSALLDNTTGFRNVGIGYNSLDNNKTGNYNCALGHEANSACQDYDNCIGIGYNTKPNASNKVYIGNTSMTWIGGEVNWSTYSDSRIKNNINEDVKGLDFIQKLRPVTFHYDIDKQQKILYNEVDTNVWEGKYDIEKIKFSGFVAQEVAVAANNSGYDFSGVIEPNDESNDLYSLRMAEFIPALVKAVQQLDDKIKQLVKENKMLSAQIDSIK